MKRRKHLTMHDWRLYGVPAGVPHLVLAENEHGVLIQVRYGSRYVPSFMPYTIA